MNEDKKKNYGYYGTWPKEWKRGDPLKMTVHVIYNHNNFHTPKPIPCNGCKQVILDHHEEIEKELEDNKWIFVKHANYEQEYGATDFSSVVEEYIRKEDE